MRLDKINILGGANLLKNLNCFINEYYEFLKLTKAQVNLNNIIYHNDQNTCENINYTSFFSPP
jgi:hypothetical protein